MTIPQNRGSLRTRIFPQYTRVTCIYVLTSYARRYIFPLSLLCIHTLSSEYIYCCALSEREREGIKNRTSWCISRSRICLGMTDVASFFFCLLNETLPACGLKRPSSLSLSLPSWLVYYKMNESNFATIYVYSRFFCAHDVSQL